MKITLIKGLVLVVIVLAAIWASLTPLATDAASELGLILEQKGALSQPFDSLQKIRAMCGLAPSVLSSYIAFRAAGRRTSLC